MYFGLERCWCTQCGTCVKVHGALQALVRARRPDGAHAYRERAHLLILYEDLVSCVASRELRVRSAVQALLLLAGEEIGLIPKSSPPSPLKAAGVVELGL